MSPLVRFVCGALVLLAVLAAVPVVALRGSLPATSGRHEVPGIRAPVSIGRDALGVPTITGENRADVAYATGYLHAQDRFFQMDLARRMSAGRLAELVGDAALPTDRRNRLHRFGALAARVIAAASDEERGLLEAYSAGVNAGLASLKVRAFEYLLLRSDPQPWQPADSILVIYAMYLQLNDARADADRRRTALRDSLPPALFDFVHAVAPEWEAPIDGAITLSVPIPGPEVLDLRAPAARADAGARGAAVAVEPALPGSNNWALAGHRTGSGAGMVANDMHLGLSVPNTWYRARLVVHGNEPRDLAGLTLPGAPLLVAGSNGRVAWGFTNSYGDYSDLVEVELSADGSEYRGATGWRAVVIERERIASSSGASEVLPLYLTEWGPLLDPESGGGRAIALRWTAHEPEATNLRWIRLETVGDVPAALALANTIGGPVQNFVCADAQGSIGWSLLGRLPERGAGYDPSVAGDWTLPDAGWRGFLAPERYPRVIDPAGGQVWSANNRVVGGDALALIGNGAPDRGARARQIRDALAGLRQATERDMLAIQLDDRALFLERWRRLLLEELDGEALAGHAARAELRRVLASDATRASAGSAGYPYLRQFREGVARRAYGALTATTRALHPEVELRVPREFEEPAWRMMTERPAHLLDPRYGSWRDLLLAAADESVESLATDCARQGVGSCPWGLRNRVSIRHPLSRAIPSLARWLDMPSVPMSGDNDMPHVHVSGFGASERFAVSPGHEANGILHMPGGQSGHPWSPYYRAGHEAWVRGEPTPFLPGPAERVLALVPPGH